MIDLGLRLSALVRFEPFHLLPQSCALAETGFPGPSGARAAGDAKARGAQAMSETYEQRAAVKVPRHQVLESCPV
jgi:hypothetical protein